MLTSTIQNNFSTGNGIAQDQTDFSGLSLFCLLKATIAQNKSIFLIRFIYHFRLILLTNKFYCSVSSNCIYLAEVPSHKEKELLLRVAEGDKMAFHELVNGYAHILYIFIFRIIRNRPQAEDIVQDTFVKIWLTREHLSAVQNFKAYLFVISRNFAIKAVQKALRERKRIDEWKKQGEENAVQPDLEWKFMLIEEAISKLPPQQHKVWMMSRKQGMKYAAIAVELGLSKESVKKYLQFANAAIMKYVKNRLEILTLVAIYLHS